MPTTSPDPVSPAPDDIKAKWVKNLSPKLLIETQISLFARIQNLSVVPLYSPKGECVTAVEKACLKLFPKMAQELRARTSWLLKCDYPLKPNILKEKARAEEELKQDKSRVILKVSKMFAMVVLDKQDYTSKAQDLLAHRNTDSPFIADPTNEHKNKPINLLRTIKAWEEQGTTLTTGLTQQVQAPQILWFTKNTHTGHPLFP